MEDEFDKFLKDSKDKVEAGKEDPNSYVSPVDELDSLYYAHSILSMKFDVSMVASANNDPNWKPLFSGEWKINKEVFENLMDWLTYISDISTRTINEILMKNPEISLNPEYEI